MKTSSNAAPRFKRPLPVVAGGAALLMLPVDNFLSVRYYHDFTPTTLDEAVKIWTPVGFAFLALAPVVGAMILFLRKAAYLAFLAYAIGIVAFNSYILAMHSDTYNLASLVQTLAIFGMLLYFLRKDTAKPFLADQDRGWRYSKRVRVELNVTVDGVHCTTRDVSYTGMYLRCEAPQVSAGQKIAIDVADGDSSFTLKCAVIRVEAGGYAVNYDEISGEQRQRLRNFLRRQLRHPVSIGVEVGGLTYLTRNLTAEGMFINWPGHHCKVGQPLSVKVNHQSDTLVISAKVVRVETDGLAIHYPDLDAAQKAVLETLVGSTGKSSSVA
jgi:hypothetical protein